MLQYTATLETIKWYTSDSKLEWTTYYNRSKHHTIWETYLGSAKELTYKSLIKKVYTTAKQLALLILKPSIQISDRIIPGRQCDNHYAPSRLFIP